MPAFAIDAEGITKTFGSTRAVDGASVAVPAGSLVALLGPSGSGKTTLLRVIAGFERPDTGTVRIGDRIVAGDRVWTEPDRRRVGMVFQDGALFPHLTVDRNVAFGEPAPGRVAECLELVGLAHRGAAYPHELSGGERQRIALARALATDPDVVLLDEPFASLDAGLRVSLREEVAAILRDADSSALLVTHDQHEALSLADSVVIMRDGRVEQAGTPQEVYTHPANRWVAEFLDAAEVVGGTARDGRADTALGTFGTNGITGAVDVLVASDDIRVGPPDLNGATPPSAVTAHVLGHAFFGTHRVMRLRLADGSVVRSRIGLDAPWHRGDEVTVWTEGDVRILAADAR